MENDNSPNEMETESPNDNTGENQDKNKDLKSALAQKEHFRDKASKLEKELEEIRGKTQEVSNVKDNQAPQVDALEIVQLSKSLNGLSEIETNLVLSVSKSSKPKDILAALNSDVVKNAIAYEREKVERENKRPEPTNSYSNGFVDKSHQEIEKMSKEEFEAYERELYEKARQLKGRTGA